MYRVSSLVKGVVLAAFASVVIYGQCLPVTPSAINVNGIVVGRALNTGGGTTTGPCGADLGWGGVAANMLVPINNGAPNSFSAQLFAVATVSGANVDRLFLGLHVEADDRLSPGDVTVLYFDVDNNGSFVGAADFALKIEVGPLTTPTDEDCDNGVNNMTFYRFVNGNWAQQSLPANAVTPKLSWDYDAEMPDTESNLWELEIEIRPSALGTAIPTAAGVGIAAKLWIDHSNQAIPPVPLVFPSALNTTNGDAPCQDPGSSTGQPGDPCPGAAVDAATQMAKMTIGACGFDVIIKSISATDFDGTPHRIVRGYPNPIVGTPARQTTFRATVAVVNPANMADNSNLAVPNSGQVNFIGRPWYAGDFHGSFDIGSPTVQLTQLGKDESVVFNWPANEAQYKPARPLIEGPPVDHVCMQVTLSGFPTNANTNDFKQDNLTFTQASTIRDRFVLTSQRQEGLTGTNTYFLRALWENLPRKSQARAQKPNRGEWSYRFVNAARIGLKDIGQGWYSIDMKPGEERVVEVELTGGTMTYPVRRFLVTPRAGGLAATPASGHKPYNLAVKPGMIVSIVAKGTISLQSRVRQYIGPNGYAERERAGEYLLSANSAAVPFQHVGALIASTDGFAKSSFVVGGVKTFIVPPGVTNISFAVNDVIGQYGDNSGKGFEVHAILAPPLGLPTRTAMPGNPNNGQPAFPDLGAALPRLNIDVNLVDPRRKFLRPANYVAFVVYNSHP